VSRRTHFKHYANFYAKVLNTEIKFKDMAKNLGVFKFSSMILESIKTRFHTPDFSTRVFQTRSYIQPYRRDLGHIPQ
jgi:hypothetical protein